jgi:hypothetical protein
MSPDDYSTLELPDDAEAAFIVAEKTYRAEVLQYAAPGRNEYYTYINKVLGARDELQVPILSSYKCPPLRGTDDTEFRFDFRFVAGEVDRLRARIEIRGSRRNKAYSVRFDAATKQKVRHLLGQIKTIVDEVELDDRKKEALYAKINALEIEFDRDRTRFDAFGAFFIEVAGVVGEAANKMEPVRKLIDSIAKLFGAAKSYEDENPQLPPHREPKKIEAPRKRLPAPKPDD